MNNRIIKKFKNFVMNDFINGAENGALHGKMLVYLKFIECNIHSF